MAVSAMTADAARPASPAKMLHASNLLTYASLLMGLVAIAAALWYGSRSVAGMSVGLIVVLDTFDGRFARQFQRTATEKSFGAQLDSLADAVNSGIVPIAVMTALVRPTNVVDAMLWIAAAFVYLVGVVTRLGFYNLASEDGHVFIGLPASVAALTVATLLLWPVATVPAATVLVGCGLAMVSAIRIDRPKGLGLFLFVLWPLTVIALHLANSLTTASGYGSSPLGP